MNQLIRIGDGDMPCWATYNQDDCGLLFIERLTTQDGIDLIDYFTCDQLETMAKKLDAGHEQALRDARNRSLEDLAEERCRDREL